MYLPHSRHRTRPMPPSCTSLTTSIGHGTLLVYFSISSYTFLKLESASSPSSHSSTRAPSATTSSTTGVPLVLPFSNQGHHCPLYLLLLLQPCKDFFPASSSLDVHCLSPKLVLLYLSSTPTRPLLPNSHGHSSGVGGGGGKGYDKVVCPLFPQEKTSF